MGSVTLLGSLLPNTFELDAKESVRAATTAAGTLASDFEAGDTIDGVTLVAGDRILIKNQADGSENGIYVAAASGAPSRAADADAATEVTAGMYCFVEEGTANADTGWILTTDGAITLDTTALTFAQFTGGGGGGGETNTASNVNTAGVGVFKQKTGVDLEFRGIIADSTKVAVVLDAPNNEIGIDVVEAQIDHDALNNYVAEEHVDWAASGAGTIHTDNYIEGGPGTDTTAIHDDTASEISAVTEKVTPVSGDLLLIEDSAAANAKKRVQIGNLPFGTGDGDVVGPASSTDNAIARFDGTTGKLIQTSGATLDDGGGISAASLTSPTVIGTTVVYSQLLMLIQPTFAWHAQLQLTDGQLTSSGFVEQETTGDLQLRNTWEGGLTIISAEDILGARQDLVLDPDEAFFPDDPLNLDLGKNLKRWNRLFCDLVDYQTFIQGKDIPTPSTPAAGEYKFYFDEDNGGRATRLDSSGVEHNLEDTTDPDAIHDNVAGEINALTEKATPVNGDWVVIEDSAASNAKKKAQLGNLPGGGGGSTVEVGRNSTSSFTITNTEQVVTGLNISLTDAPSGGFQIIFTGEFDNDTSGGTVLHIQLVRDPTGTPLTIGQEWIYDWLGGDRPELITIHYGGVGNLGSASETDIGIKIWHAGSANDKTLTQAELSIMAVTG